MEFRNPFKKRTVTDALTKVEMAGGMSEAGVVSAQEVEKIKNIILSKNDVAYRIKTWENSGYVADWEAIAKGYKENSSLEPTITKDKKIVWGNPKGKTERASVY